MRLIALPDLHNTGVNFLYLIAAELAEVDLVVLVGDLTNGGPAADVVRVVEAVQAFNPSVLAVPGNWDSPEVNACLTELGINLHRSHRVIGGLAFVGVGGALPSVGRTPTEFSESAFRSYLSEAAQGLDPQSPLVLVSHQPPFNTRNDDATRGLHLGSRSVRSFIEQTQPLLCLTGHHHAAVAIDDIGPTRIINPGPLWKGAYAFAELSSNAVLSLQIRQCPPADR